MKSIVNTFVLVAPDCPAREAVVPKPSASGRTVASLQHQLLTEEPYALTLQDLIFRTHVARSGPSGSEDEIHAELFARSHPCMRASPLTKRYGWGVHHDAEGRMALYPVESKEYARFAAGQVPGVELVAAMRSKRER
jgi:hypothetical protein